MTRTWAITAAMVLGMGSLLLADEPEKVTFKPVYKPGKYVMTTNMEANQTVKTAARQIEQSTTNLIVYGLDVAKPDAQGDTAMLVTYRRFKQETKIDGKVQLSYDSDSPAEKQDASARAIFEPLLKAQVKIVAAADGTIKSASGMDAMWDSLVAANKSNPQMAAIFEGMKASMGDKMLKESFGQSAKALPQKPVAVGESWTMDLALPMFGQAKMQTKSTLKSVEAGPPRLAVVEFTGKLNTDQPTTAKVGPSEVTIAKIDMDTSGTNKIDLDSGIVISGESRQKGTVEMSIPTPAGAQSSTIEQDSKITIQTKPDTGEASPATAPK